MTQPETRLVVWACHVRLRQEHCAHRSAPGNGAGLVSLWVEILTSVDHADVQASAHHRVSNWRVVETIGVAATLTGRGIPGDEPSQCAMGDARTTVFDRYLVPVQSVQVIRASRPGTFWEKTDRAWAASHGLERSDTRVTR
jgi:hypothetical protein